MVIRVFAKILAGHVYKPGVPAVFEVAQSSNNLPDYIFYHRPKRLGKPAARR